MSDSESGITTADIHTAEYLEADQRAQAWAASLDQPPTQEEFNAQFYKYHEEEKKKQMKTRAALQREKAKAEAEIKRQQAQKRFKSPKPATETTGEAMDTDNISVLPPHMVPPSTRFGAENVPEKKATKRTVEKIIDPDSGKDAPDPKISNVPLDKAIKRLCLKSILEMFSWLVGEEKKIIADDDCVYNLNVSNALVTIIFTTYIYNE